MLEKYIETQNSVTTILTKSLKNNKLVQAYLFSCDDIEFIYNYAKDFAKEIISYSKQDKEKLESIYKRINSEQYNELKIIIPEGNVIKKNQLLDLQNSVVNKPVEGNKIIYIIKNCEKLNISSANCILKFLEEPEDDIIAILLTDNINMVMPTIKSRCQILNFQNKSIVNKMENISFFDNVEDELREKDIFINSSIELVNNIEQFKLNTYVKIKKLIYDVFKSQEDLTNLCNVILYIYDDCLHYKISNNVNYMEDYISFIEQISSLNSKDSLIKKIIIVETVKNQSILNVNLKLLIDKLIIELSEVEV